MRGNYAISADEFYEKHASGEKLPVILQFQPTEFEIIEDPERLRVWERNLAERVGLVQVDGRGEMVLMSGTCCESKCPDVDDCDEDQFGSLFSVPPPPPS